MGVKKEVITKAHVYEKFGKVSEAAQQYEFGLATMLLFLEYFGKGWWSKTPKLYELDSLMQKLNKKTLGQLLKSVKDLRPFGHENAGGIDNVLSDAHNVRNIIAHNFFTKDTERIHNYDGRREMLHELEEFHEKLNAANLTTASIVSALYKLKEDLKDTKNFESMIELVKWYNNFPET